MTIGPGSRIGPYEVVALLGEGGMGKVWRAHHSTLNRDDALKVLPDAFASDPERLARFRREAQVLASLNHPNIAHVYGLEQSDGVQALVMELVEGSTLADRIAQGPISVDEVLPIAKQIAEALEAAHEQGIIHRDLKPANIKVRPDGTVKVLDFGLAKALEPVSAAGVDATASPTITSPAMMTGVGMLLGTAAYMSPEQAKGRAADKRGDVWAFGCVLYEMMTGRRAFEAEDVSETLAFVMAREPDWSELPSDLPPAIHTLLRRSLEKEPRKRLSNIAAALVLIEEAPSLTAAARGVPAPVGMMPDVVRSRRRIPLTTAVAVLVSSAAVGTAMWWATRPAPLRVIRTELTTSGTTALSIGGVDRDVAITPDGTRIIYRGDNQLIVRALDALEPTVLNGLGTPRGLFVSPDSQWVGFYDGSLLKKVAITGGSPITLTPIGGAGRGATWGVDGTIVYASTGIQTGLQSVSAAGGNPTVLTTPDRERGEADHVWPEFLPGGRGVLFTITGRATEPTDSQIAVLDLESGTYKVLVRGGSHAHYMPTGHLVYGAGGTLRAMAFDLGPLEVHGTSVPVLENVLTTGLGAVDFTVAADGTLLYVPGVLGSSEALRSLVLVDRSGQEEAVPAPLRTYAYPRISPDGTRAAFDIRDQDFDIWMWDFARHTLTRLTFDPGQDEYPVWMPDGRRLVFGSGPSNAQNVFWQSADGTGTPTRLTESPNDQDPQTVTPDGKLIIVRELVGGGADLTTLAFPSDPDSATTSQDRGTSTLSRLIKTTFNEGNAEISPDGRWLAHESNESGRAEVYVRPFPNVSGGRWQVSTGGGRMPLWSRNGQELFYVSPDAALMGVPVEPGPSWRGGTPARILQGPYFYGNAGRTFDIMPDGKRFLMIKPGGAGETAPSQNLVLVQNWFEELKRLVPTN